MKQYGIYKDSGIEWIGEIPENWNSIKLKYLGYLYSGLSGKKGDDFKRDDSEFNKNYIPFTNIANNSAIDPKRLDSVEVFENENQNSVEKNDLFFLMSSENYDDIGKTAILQEEIADTYLNSFCKGFRLFNQEEVDAEFLNYLLAGDIYRKILSIEAKGFTRINLQMGKIQNLPVILPEDKQQQKQIANYLDYKTSLIDNIIAQKEQLINKLKEQRQSIINEAVTKGLNPDVTLKDSGIEWLGEIPVHWEVTKLKYICNAFGRIGYRGYTTADIVDKGKGAITISPSNIERNVMDFNSSTYISWEKYEESPEIQIFNDDILMVKTGSTYGKVGIVKNLEEKATINPQLLVFKNITVNPNFLFEVLRMPLIQSQVDTGVIGSTIPTISQTKILDFALAIPSDEDEIKEITDFLRIKNDEIDKLNHKLINSIHKLKEFRQSLISEAVTGKIDVRDWEEH